MSARFVKLQLPGEGFLHLDQVEIYDRGWSTPLAASVFVAFAASRGDDDGKEGAKLSS